MVKFSRQVASGSVAPPRGPTCDPGSQWRGGQLVGREEGLCRGSPRQAEVRRGPYRNWIEVAPVTLQTRSLWRRSRMELAFEDLPYEFLEPLFRLS